MAETPSPNPNYSNFRLSLEQQRKRAKELLRAAKRGDPAALERLRAAQNPNAATLAEPKLAAAQYTIARELRFSDWAALRHHIAVLTRERQAIEEIAVAGPDNAPDGDLTTLHFRCGSDIALPLKQAGFIGNFREHSYPYLIGPVREGPGALEQRADFIVQSFADDSDPPLTRERVLESLQRNERELRDSSDYERVVIWSEHDCYDQLVLIRLLGHYAKHGCPRTLELVSLSDFPGVGRFVGLGQLPPEALRMLWKSRVAVDKAQLQLGLAAWQALASPDPRALADIARAGTPALPLLGPALRRHLAELPAIDTGLSLTESMALELLAQGPMSLAGIFSKLTSHVDPLPGQGDLQVRDRVLGLERAREPLIVRTPRNDSGGQTRPPWTDVLTITPAGSAVLRSGLDYMDLGPPSRWVGGVRVGGDNPDWRWDREAGRALLRRIPGPAG